MRPGELTTGEALFYRGEGHKAQAIGDLDTAEASYRKAIINNPYYAEAYVDLGVVLESRAKLADAEAAYLAALKINPMLGAAHTNLGFLYEKQGNIKEAAKYWQARVMMGPDDDLWVLKAKEKLRKYNLPVPESAALMKKKREAEIKRAYEAGLRHLKAKEWDQAIAEFQKVLALDPGHKRALKGLKEAVKASGKAPPSIGAGGADVDAIRAAMDAALLGEGATGQADQASRWADEAGRKSEEARRRIEAAHKAAKEADRMAALRRSEVEKWKAEEAKRARALKEAEETNRRLNLHPEEETMRQQAIQDVEAAGRQAEEAGIQAEKAQMTAETAKKIAQGANKDQTVKRADEASKRALEVKQTSDATFQEAEQLKQQLGVAVPAEKGPAASTGKTTDRATALKAAAEMAASVKKGSAPKVKAAAADFANGKTKDQQQTIRELYQRGVTAMRQGDYQSAVTHFEQVLALNPNHTEAKQGLKRAQIALSKSIK